jgi:hypothetical protein
MEKGRGVGPSGSGAPRGRDDDAALFGVQFNFPADRL